MSTENDYSVLKNEVLTVREIAAYLRVSRVTIWRWCHQGLIPAFQVGRSWRVRRDDLLRYIEEFHPAPSTAESKSDISTSSDIDPPEDPPESKRS